MYFRWKKYLDYDRFLDPNILGAARLVHSDLRIYQISFFLLDINATWHFKLIWRWSVIPEAVSSVKEWTNCKAIHLRKIFGFNSSLHLKLYCHNVGRWINIFIACNLYNMNVTFEDGAISSWLIWLISLLVVILFRYYRPPASDVLYGFTGLFTGRIYLL